MEGKSYYFSRGRPCVARQKCLDPEMYGSLFLPSILTIGFLGVGVPPAPRYRRDPPLLPAAVDAVELSVGGARPRPLLDDDVVDRVRLSW